MALQLSEELTITLCANIAFKLREGALLTGLEVNDVGLVNLTAQFFSPLGPATQALKDFVQAIADTVRAQEGHQNGD